jgi:hypothetical protein
MGEKETVSDSVGASLVNHIDYIKEKIFARYNISRDDLRMGVVDTFRSRSDGTYETVYRDVPYFEISLRPDNNMAAERFIERFLEESAKKSLQLEVIASHNNHSVVAFPVKKQDTRKLVRDFYGLLKKTAEEESDCESEKQQINQASQ